MADYFGSNDRGERELARHLLAFAAGVVPPPASDFIENDEPDDFDQNVAFIAAYIAQLALSVPMLATVAYGLEPCADASWGKLAEELPGITRQTLDISPLPFGIKRIEGEGGFSRPA